MGKASLTLCLFLGLNAWREKKPPVLVNRLFGTAKLVIWKTMDSQMLGQGWTDVVQSLKGLVVGL